MKYSLKGNNNACKKLYRQGMMKPEKVNELFKEYNSDELDAYHLCGDLINSYMLKHPYFQKSWLKMSADERWIYVEMIHYGIEGLIRENMQFVNCSVCDKEKKL
jgi:hypothetical protein